MQGKRLIGWLVDVARGNILHQMHILVDGRLKP